MNRSQKKYIPLRETMRTVTIAVFHWQIFARFFVYIPKNPEKSFHWANIPDGVKSRIDFWGHISINLNPSLGLDWGFWFIVSLTFASRRLRLWQFCTRSPKVWISGLPFLWERSFRIYHGRKCICATKTRR